MQWKLESTWGQPMNDCLERRLVVELGRTVAV